MAVLAVITENEYLLVGDGIGPLRFGAVMMAL
jgi:hypothetical protein